jgi:hypothetical protein
VRASGSFLLGRTSDARAALSELPLTALAVPRDAPDGPATARLPGLSCCAPDQERRRARGVTINRAPCRTAITRAPVAGGWCARGQTLRSDDGPRATTQRVAPPTDICLQSAAAATKERIGERPWIGSAEPRTGLLAGGQRAGRALSWHAHADQAPLTRGFLPHHPAGPGPGRRIIEVGAALLCLGSSHACTVARRKRSAKTPQGQPATPRGGLCMKGSDPFYPKSGAIAPSPCVT